MQFSRYMRVMNGLFLHIVLKSSAFSVIVFFEYDAWKFLPQSFGNKFPQPVAVISSSVLSSLPNGDNEIRTRDPLLARQVLSQLSYTPVGSLFFLAACRLMGLSGLEPPTSRLSGVRSNRLSYKPGYNLAATCSPMPSPA